MLKLFLVEDDESVREEIKQNINWKELGVELCGEAGDGELAWPMIQRAQPNLILTDIMMPFMDGLTLSKLIKKEYPWMEIILFSGFQDFRYAQEGIKIGVAQYLSKPISSYDLNEAIEMISNKIMLKQSEIEMIEKYQQEMEGNSLQERMDFFQYLVEGSQTIAELLDMADQIHMDISASWYNMILLKIQTEDLQREAYSVSLVGVNQKLSEIHDCGRMQVFDRGLEGIAYLLMGDSKEEIERNQTRFIERVEMILSQFDNIRYYGGVGSVVNRLSKLAFSYERASRNFAHRYFSEENRIWNQNGSEEAFLEEDSFNVNQVNVKNLDRTRIDKFLRMGDRGETIYFVEEYFKDIGASVVSSLMFRQYVAMDAYFCVIGFLEENGFPKETTEVLEMNSGVLKSVDASMAYVTRIIGQAIGLRDQMTSNRYGNVIEQVKKYIEENYADEELSLNTLASFVNFSPSHLSMIFSQETGVAFIKYLTDLRMQKAKEMLRCSNKRANEIALEVGYKDSHYFSFLFKKLHGMTPTQYREKRQVESA